MFLPIYQPRSINGITMSIPGGAGGSDAKKLEGRPEGEEGKFLPREFFWDSVALYVVSAIIGLAAIDVVTEFIRGSSVSCYAPSGVAISEKQEEYINNFCSASLPMTEYIPAFILVHGILIAIPHYLWLNHYGGNFDFFFTQASKMDRTRDENTGEYSNNNRLIIQQLTQTFTTYKQNWMFILYVVKLTCQWVISIAGFIAAIFYFTDFDDVFFCPRNNATVSDEFWPLDEQVRCVFTSLRLFSTIRIADLILLALVVLCFSWSLIWSASTHSTELGFEEVALFSFQSGISPEHHISKLLLPSWCCRPCKNCLRKLITTIPWLGRGPRIHTNLDFLLLKLFRTDSGLGHIFREMLIHENIKHLNDDDLRRTNLHTRQQQDLAMSDGALITSRDVKGFKRDLKWNFTKKADRSGLFHANREPYSLEHTLRLPDTIRGAILGFASRAPRNDVAIYITFGSTSRGIPLALTRIFQKVGVVNFNPFYQAPDPENPVSCTMYGEPDIVYVQCQEDILSSELSVSNEFGSGLWAFWDPDPEEHKADFIVVGPIDNELHLTTVTLFLVTLKENLSHNCVLLTIHPKNISGKMTGDEFQSYSPPSDYFEAFDQKVVLDPAASDPEWPPQKPSKEPHHSDHKSPFEYTVSCGCSQSSIVFGVYKYPPTQPQSKKEQPAEARLEIPSS